VPTNKDLKRIVRTRMQKTGESYTIARTHVLSKPKPKAPPAPTVDHAALAGMSDDKVAAKTGRTWKEWVRVLDADDAAAMPHRNIAELLHRKHLVPDWWAQTVTVGYERIKGLRDRGQRRGGGYEAGKNRTFAVPVKTLFDAWADDATRRRWLGRNDITVRTATSPKGIRLQWPDGTVVVVLFSAKGKSKSVASVVHTKLPDRSALESAKTYWGDRLDALGSVLEDRN
jgi:hypothetical protein